MPEIQQFYVDPMIQGPVDPFANRPLSYLEESASRELDVCPPGGCPLYGIEPCFCLH